MLSEFSFCLLVPNSFLLLLEWHLFLVAWHLFLIASCYYNFCILSTQICSTIAFSTLRFTNDELVQATATPLIIVVALLQPLAGVVFTWDGLFQGLSDARS